MLYQGVIEINELHPKQFLVCAIKILHSQHNEYDLMALRNY